MESVERLRKACEGHRHTSCADIPHLICDAFGLGHHPYDWGAVLLPVCDAIELELAERYAELPVDADGVPWHRGDQVKSLRGEIKTVWIAGDNTLVTDDHQFLSPAREYRHHYAPTVEDVLREFGDWYAHTKGGCDEDGIIAEYAAKLRLANSEE